MGSMLELAWIPRLVVTLPFSMMDKLHYVVLFSLSDIGCLDFSLLNNQGWINADLIGLTDQTDITC